MFFSFANWEKIFIIMASGKTDNEMGWANYIFLIKAHTTVSLIMEKHKDTVDFVIQMGIFI